MRAKFFLNDADHQRRHATWMKTGLEKHGIICDAPRSDYDMSADFIVTWGWRRAGFYQDAIANGVPVLVMERGHIQPRMEETSIGWNGLAGLSVRPDCMDDGARFRKKFAHYMKPWHGQGYVLVMGQIAGDAALHGSSIRRWEADACNAYIEAGHEVRYRPHPMDVPSRRVEYVRNIDQVSLEDALKGAALCVTFSSTSAVEAVLSGTPTVTCHEGSVSRPVTAHGLLAEPVTPNRIQWAERLAWAQFLPEEISSGLAWEVVSTCMPTA